MAPKRPPKPSILDDLEYFGIRQRRKVWRSPDGQRYYTWDSQHGEVEVFDKQGYHLGTLDATEGKPLKPAVKGRRLRI